MSFSERTYRGDFFRPRPEWHLEKDESLLVLVVPWGKKESAKRVIDIVQAFISSMKQDREVTSPFEELTCLHPFGNDIRTAFMLANDQIFRNENQVEYSSGVEVLALIRTETTLHWAQVGHWNVFLDRFKSPLIPLQMSSDFVLEMSLGERLLSPLPKSLLGVASTSHFYVQEFCWRKQDRVILINRSTLPKEFYTLPREKRTLQNITQLCANDHADMPFWLGIFDL